MEIIELKKNWIYKLLRRHFYLWIAPRKLQKRIEETIRQKYYLTTSERCKASEKKVICMIDGRARHGGLSDRLMGIVATYSLCKELGLDFRINFTYPFLLSDYLEPNEVNWIISPEELCYYPADAHPVYVDSMGGTAEKKLQRKWLKTEILKPYKQIHVYTNAHFAMNSSYSGLFHTLFKPSEQIRKELDFHRSKLNGEYICVALRFQKLLGDFEEEGDFAVLDTAQRLDLINRCIGKIKELKSVHLDWKFLITSDSATFLQKADELDFVYIIPGALGHMDYAAQSADANEADKKVFVDFLMTANAQKSYLLRTGDMYQSRFPRSASFVNNIPFEIIEF